MSLLSGVRLSFRFLGLNAFELLCLQFLDIHTRKARKIGNSDPVCQKLINDNAKSTATLNPKP